MDKLTTYDGENTGPVVRVIESPVPPPPSLSRYAPAVMAPSIPDFLRYAPPQHPTLGPGSIDIDVRREVLSGLECESLAERLQRNGVREMVLRVLVEVAQDKAQPGKVRVDAAKALLDRSEGSVTPQRESTQVAVLVKIDR